MGWPLRQRPSELKSRAWLQLWTGPPPQPKRRPSGAVSSSSGNTRPQLLPGMVLRPQQSESLPALLGMPLPHSAAREGCPPGCRTETRMTPPLPAPMGRRGVQTVLSWVGACPLSRGHQGAPTPSVQAEKPLTASTPDFEAGKSE